VRPSPTEAAPGRRRQRGDAAKAEQRNRRNEKGEPAAAVTAEDELRVPEQKRGWRRPKQQQQKEEAGQPPSRSRGGGNSRRKNKRSNSRRHNGDDDVVLPYPPYLSMEECLERYARNADDGTALARGRLRVLPGATSSAASFVTCDRGRHASDICIPSALERNRALDGEVVFVELLPSSEEGEGEDDDGNNRVSSGSIGDSDSASGRLRDMSLNDVADDNDNEIVAQGDDACADECVDDGEPTTTWQDDPVQMNLWNPIVPTSRVLQRKSSSQAPGLSEKARRAGSDCKYLQQQKGRVVRVLPPKSLLSELDPAAPAVIPRRKIVGTIKVLPSGGGGRNNGNITSSSTILLTPNNRSLPQFKCSTTKTVQELLEGMDARAKELSLFQAEYEHGSWLDHFKWPPCTNLTVVGESFVIEDEIRALLTEFDVDHGTEFPAAVVKEVDDAVQSGLFLDATTGEQGWKPTLDMHKGRRDYRSERIFTIDPTTAKDLDDALHIKQLPGGRVEIGVHIADVSFFVQPGTAVDEEAQRRTTTVYLVDRTIPMLPRPLCEIACSLNENVERLAFSCVWTMNMDGTLRGNSLHRGSEKVQVDDIWYGRTVIRSCARLDYATAQNIIDNKVATGEEESNMDEVLWPKSRRPTAGRRHTVDQVANDVRLMHKVAMARRKLRFENGALALHGTKLVFQLDENGMPQLAAPYPIRDSNRLVEGMIS